MKTIKEVAEAFGMTTRTIRYYEELGMLKPQRTEANRRMYAPAEVAKLKLIDRGKRYGFSLEEIKEMVLLFDVDRSGEKQLERTIEYGEQQIRENEGGLHPAGRRLLLRITNFYNTQQFQFPVNWRSYPDRGKYYPESVNYYPHSQNTIRLQIQSEKWRPADQRGRYAVFHLEDPERKHYRWIETREYLSRVPGNCPYKTDSCQALFK